MAWSLLKAIRWLNLEAGQGWPGGRASSLLSLHPAGQSSSAATPSLKRSSAIAEPTRIFQRQLPPAQGGHYPRLQVLKYVAEFAHGEAGSPIATHTCRGICWPAVSMPGTTMGLPPLQSQLAHSSIKSLSRKKFIEETITCNPHVTVCCKFYARFM